MDKERQQLIENNLNLALKIAWKFTGTGNGIEFEDLRQIACIGLIEAATRFDKSKNVRFSVFAWHWIYYTILQEFRDDKQRNIRRGERNPFRMCSLDDEELRLQISTNTDTDFENVLNTIVVEDLFSKMSYKEKEILKMYYFLNVSQKEIASHMQITQATVSRIIKKLKERFREV